MFTNVREHRTRYVVVQKRKYGPCNEDIRLGVGRARGKRSVSLVRHEVPVRLAELSILLSSRRLHECRTHIKCLSRDAPPSMQEEGGGRTTGIEL